MGGKASKDTQGQGLVPRDGTDEIEVHPKKMVTQEQFDELLHKFSLLEQLMQQDKSKISELESSVTQYQQDKQLLRRSFVEIDTEVKRDKEERERLENNLSDRVEQRTREKYQLLDQMLNSQSQRIEQLIRDQEANSERVRTEYGQLDRKLTSSLQVDREEMERLVSSKLTEETKDKGDFEKRVSQIMDQNSVSASLVREELEDRKKETQEVRDSVQREKRALLEEIARVQAIMQEAKQTEASEHKLSEQLMATKEQLEERLTEEERARAQLEGLMKTMLDNRVSENQKQFLEQIKAQENVIQAQVQRMEEMKGSMDSSVKEEQARVRQDFEQRISDLSVSHQEQLSIKEDEKKHMTRKLSQDFENRMQEMQSSLSKDIQEHRSKTDTILEDSGQEKKVAQGRLDALEASLLQKIEEANRASQLSVDSELASLREELQASLARSQGADGEVLGLREQLTEARRDLSLLRDSQTGMKDDLELMQNTLSNEIDAKIQLIIEVKVAEVGADLSEKYGRTEQSLAQLAEKLESLGTSSDPNLEPMQLEYMQKTSEEVGLLLDRMEETGSQLQSVSENTMDMDRRQQVSQVEIQQNKEQLQTAQSDLLMLRSENSELSQKYESQAVDLARVLADNSKLQQSVDSAMRLLEEQSREFEQLRSQTGPGLSVSDAPPESPLEKMEEMETVIKKQGYGLNDMQFLIDESRDQAKASAEKVENAISKFDTKLEDETAKLRAELESLRSEFTNKLSDKP